MGRHCLTPSHAGSMVAKKCVAFSPHLRACVCVCVHIWQETLISWNQYRPITYWARRKLTNKPLTVTERYHDHVLWDLSRKMFTNSTEQKLKYIVMNPGIRLLCKVQNVTGTVITVYKYLLAFLYMDAFVWGSFEMIYILFSAYFTFSLSNSKCADPWLIVGFKSGDCRDATNLTSLTAAISQSWISRIINIVTAITGRVVTELFFHTQK